MNQAEVDTTQLLKGVLDLAVLAVLADGDSYGYDVLRRLRDSGLDEVGDASVYGTLRRLYQAGALNSYVVPSDEGPHRKYYGLNERGRKSLSESARSWSDLTTRLGRMLDGRSAKNGKWSSAGGDRELRRCGAGRALRSARCRTRHPARGSRAAPGRGCRRIRSIAGGAAGHP